MHAWKGAPLESRWPRAQGRAQGATSLSENGYGPPPLPSVVRSHVVSCYGTACLLSISPLRHGP
eukprot:12917551-Prorocentrum_lima.AAC.1